MKKIIVHNCGECPEFHNKSLVCGILGLEHIIKDSTEIHENCPLEDEGEDNVYKV